MNNTQKIITGILTGAALTAVGFGVSPEKAGVTFKDGNAIVITVHNAEKYLANRVREYNQLTDQLNVYQGRPTSESTAKRIADIQERLAELDAMYEDAGYGTIAGFFQQFPQYDLLAVKAEREAAQAQREAERKAIIESRKANQITE